MRLTFVAKSCIALVSLLASVAGAYADKLRNPTAIFAGLDKITGRIIAFEASVDETVQFGSLQLTARVCYTRPGTERPQTTTFVEVEEIGADNQYKRLFSGWMFALSPGLNAIEHPVYDIWLTACSGGKEPQDLIKGASELEEEPPPPVAELPRNPRPVPPLTGARTPGQPGSTQAPLRLPSAGINPPPPGGLVPPGQVQPRQAPQQRFFPTNAPPARQPGIQRTD